MGDVLQLGNRTNVTAKVYDVRSGQRVRSVQEATTVQDSVMPLFGKLAQKILNVAPPSGTSLGAIGTTSVAAYQAYLEGVQALNGFQIDQARQALERALQLDSTFSLAHYKLAIAYGWGDGNDPRIRTHAEAAARLSTALPARERGLINGHVLHARREFGRSCDAFSALIRADSSDVDAWYGLGDCRYHDPVVEPEGGDTTRMQFRGSLNESLRAFRRALELDPTNHLAYQHLVDGYLLDARTGRACVGNQCSGYQAMPIRSGDSLLLVPVNVSRGLAPARAQIEEYLRTRSRLRNVETAIAIAEQWIAASPAEERAHGALALALLSAGRVEEAGSHIEKANVAGQMYNALTNALTRMEIVAKHWRGADAIRVYDSTRAANLILRGSPALGSIVSLFGPMLGRMTEFDSAMQSSMAQAIPNAPAQQRLIRFLPRLLLGLGDDSVAAIERAVWDETSAASGRAVATRMMALTLTFGPRRPVSELPALDTTLTDTRALPVIAAYLGDTIRGRRAALRLDSISSGLKAALLPDSGNTLLAARAYLAVRDSMAALRMTRRMLDSTFLFTPLISRQAGYPYAVYVVHAMVLRADLAAALGQQAEARLWYKRFLDMWTSASPEYRPFVERVRKSYAAVGGT